MFICTYIHIYVRTYLLTHIHKYIRTVCNRIQLIASRMICVWVPCFILRPEISITDGSFLINQIYGLVPENRKAGHGYFLSPVSHFVIYHHLPTDVAWSLSLSLSIYIYVCVCVRVFVCVCVFERRDYMQDYSIISPAAWRFVYELFHTLGLPHIRYCDRLAHLHASHNLPPFSMNSFPLQFKVLIARLSTIREDPLTVVTTL